MRLGDFDAYAGLGPLLYLLSAHETFFGGSSTEHETRSGLVTAAGIGHQLGPGLLGLDVRAEFATTDQVITGNAGLHGVALSFAYAVSL